jgi:outer membrane PBP1 activator LpoA protein
MKHTYKKSRCIRAVSVLVVTALLAACGGSAPDQAPLPESAVRPQAATAAAPKLRAGAATTQDVIDRALSAQAAAKAVAATR